MHLARTPPEESDEPEDEEPGEAGGEAAGDPGDDDSEPRRPLVEKTLPEMDEVWVLTHAKQVTVISRFQWHTLVTPWSGLLQFEHESENKNIEVPLDALSVETKIIWHVEAWRRTLSTPVKVRAHMRH